MKIDSARTVVLWLVGILDNVWITFILAILIDFPLWIVGLVLLFVEAIPALWILKVFHKSVFVTDSLIFGLWVTLQLAVLAMTVMAFFFLGQSIPFGPVLSFLVPALLVLLLIARTKNMMSLITIYQ